jgi:hypothetical protein
LQHATGLMVPSSAHWLLELSSAHRSDYFVGIDSQRKERIGVATKKRGQKHKPISEKQRAEDDKLREQTRHIDLKVFDKALERAINPKK